MDYPIIQVGISANNWMTDIASGVNRLTFKPQYFIWHWMAGYLYGTDRTFNDPNRQASAHFGIGRNPATGQIEIHQYVDIKNVSFGANNWYYNKTGINIEVEGGPTIPIDDAIYDACKWLGAKLCSDEGITPTPKTFLRHQQVGNQWTECPGTLNVGRIMTDVYNTLTGQVHPGASNPTPAPQRIVVPHYLIPDSDYANPDAQQDRAAVKLLQRRLAQVGYPVKLDDGTIVDNDNVSGFGYLGNKTRLAVLSFQIAKGILPQGSNILTQGAGYVGSKTLPAINNA